jgi:hypothetical protein
VVVVHHASPDLFEGWEGVSTVLAIYKQVGRGMVHNYHYKLYESMPRRMKAVMEAQEGHTKY